MASVMSAITNTVPITQFNRGLAGKIFDEVKQCGAKVVMKNNTAECVLTLSSFFRASRLAVRQGRQFIHR